MKKTLITVGCALIAPLAFAQTSTTTTESTTSSPITGSASTTETTSTSSKPLTSTTTETTTTSTEGTVTTFTPGKTIVVKRSTGGPATYTLGKTVTYTTRGGKTIEASMIKPGVPVHVYYDTPCSTTVSRVVVDQD